MRYLLPLLFLVGCANGSELPGPIEALVDPAFSESEQVEIKLAVGDWQSAVEFSETAPPTRVYFVREAPLNPTRVGQCDQIGGLIRIKPGYRIDHLRRVAIHEIGHALGLGHEKNTDSIMYPNIVNAAPEITAVDIADYYDHEPWIPQ